MSLARRLLMSAGGTGSFFPPAPTAPSLIAANNSGNNQLTVPSAIRIDSTHTGVGYVDGSGNVECIVYDHDTETVGGPYTIHASFEVDAHSSPAFLRRSDGRWLVFYSLHNSVPFNVRLSTNADDWSSWGSATNLDSQLGGSNYTDYLVVPHLSTNLLVYRDEPTPGTDSRWCYSTHTSPAVTGWTGQTILYRESGSRSYLSGWGNGARTDFVVTNGSFTKLGHFYADGVWRRSDGTSMGSPPFDFSDVTEIYSGSVPFIWNLVLDASGYPVIAGRDELDYVYCRWDGAAWTSTVVASCGTGYEYNGPGTGFIAYGACVDDLDPDTMWLIKDVASQPEVFRYQTSDGGSTFSASQITSGSTELQTQLIAVRDARPELRAVFARGPFTDYNNWNQATVAIATESAPEPPGGDPDFMDRPTSGSISVSGGTSALIENKAIQGGSLNAPAGQAITISNVTGSVVIRDVDFSDVVGGIYIVDCSGTLLIENVRGRNVGDGTIGSGHSNYIQFSRCTFDGSVRECRFLGGRTEDMISIYQSGGLSAGHELIIEDNALQGLVSDTSTARAWTSSSGTGIIVGDSPGDSRNGFTIVRNNTLLTPGQVGIQHIDGNDLETTGNVILGEQRASNNNPMTSYAGNPSGSAHDNTYYWTNMDGSHPDPWNGAGTMTFTSNTEDAGLDPADYQVVL